MIHVDSLYIQQFSDDSRRTAGLLIKLPSGSVHSLKITVKEANKLIKIGGLKVQQRTDYISYYS